MSEGEVADVSVGLRPGAEFEIGPGATDAPAFGRSAPRALATARAGRVRQTAKARCLNRARPLSL
jgi:hypothetical protein